MREPDFWHEHPGSARPGPPLCGAVRATARAQRRRRPPTRAMAAALSLAAALALPAAPAWADDDDAARARAALQAGEVAPLAKVLAAVQAQWRGEVIAVELDHEDEGWVYEVKLLGPRGSVIKLDYDARTVTLRKSRGAGIDEARRAP